MVLVTACQSEDDGLPVNTAPIPRILELSPENAGPGSQLTIKGMNFSSDVSRNEVKFNQTMVPVELATDSTLLVTIPAELTGMQVGVTVRSNGKISNKKMLALVQIKKFGDDFNRANSPVADASADPNPLGEFWKITLGRFGLTDNRLVSDKEGGFESLMFYEPEGLDMKTGEGNFFKMSVEMQGSAGSFAGVIFNAQEDRKRFYLLRVNGPLVQFLKSGPSGLNDWARVVFSEEIAGFGDGVPYRIEISSSNPGQLLFKVVGISTNDLLLERTITDTDPYTGGVPGFYYFGLANPVAISYDNLAVEIQ